MHCFKMAYFCDFYFNDLKQRGSEWVGAKFEQEFRAQRELAEQQLKALHEDYWYLSPISR